MDATRLNQMVARVLKEELREDENSRKQGLEQFRDWILKNPDIRDCITDDSFLLPFLRARKYSVPMAEQTLVRLLRFKRDFPSLHYNLDIQDPDINDLISEGYILISPIRKSNGETVALAIPKMRYVEKYKHEKMLRTVMLVNHAVFCNEASQVLGLTTVLDYSEVTPAMVSAFPIAELKAVVESFEKSFPIRIKMIHIVNLPPVSMWVVKLLVALFSEKIQKRVMFHGSVEELHKHLDPSVLPKEYGGTMPMEEMIGIYKKELATYRESILAVNNIKLVGDSFNDGLGCGESGNLDMSGSFRKLEVD